MDFTFKCEGFALKLKNTLLFHVGLFKKSQPGIDRTQERDQSSDFEEMGATNRSARDAFGYKTHIILA